MENDGQAQPTSDQSQQPIGTTVMNTDVLKEPRGFMRCIQWFFAMVAFATCANYASYSEYQVKCKGEADSRTIKHDFSYPFRLDHSTPVNITCKNGKPFEMYPPGDFKSDAEFFVFTGVVAFLGALATLAVYVFFSRMYMDEQKKAPFYDFCFTVVIAVFWLSASAAWANGVITLKYVADPNNWIFSSENSICQLTTNGTYVNSNAIDKCAVTFAGKFGGANGSVILGFLNFFLWASNLWFVYKETSWFANRSQTGQPQQLSA